MPEGDQDRQRGAFASGSGDVERRVSVPREEPVEEPMRTSRRTILIGGAAAAWGATVVGSNRSEAAAPRPEREALKPGDRFEIVGGEQKGEILKPDMLMLGEAPLEGFPLDPQSGVLRRRNRLNRILALRFDPADMDAPTRERSVEGVLVYSAICTHLNCTVSAWMPEKRHLRCPCHLSEFAALSEGSVMNGPARRQLPMVPLALDDEGFVVAADVFNRKPGGESA